MELKIKEVLWSAAFKFKASVAQNTFETQQGVLMLTLYINAMHVTMHSLLKVSMPAFQICTLNKNKLTHQQIPSTTKSVLNATLTKLGQLLPASLFVSANQKHRIGWINQ